jgi:hypothetical protein
VSQLAPHLIHVRTAERRLAAARSDLLLAAGWAYNNDGTWTLNEGVFALTLESATALVLRHEQELEG